MKGMSGAPVLAGQSAVGVVSARYNSGDEWGRNSVWVVRVEDLTPLLVGQSDIRVARPDSTLPMMSRPTNGQSIAISPEPQAMATMGGDGVFVVGLDIKPGVYRTAGPAAGGSGYYALLSSTKTSDIIDNNNVAGPATIMVGPGVKAVSVSNCQAWLWQGADLNAAIDAVPQDQAGNVLGGDGVFVVGLDIKPGVYRTAGPAAGGSGYYALLSSTKTSDIIDNNNVAGPATIMVGPGVKAVSVSNCQAWFWQGADLNAAIDAVFQDPQGDTVLASAMGGDGVFVVGLDIKPGVYRTAGPAAGGSGYYALLSSTKTSDIIDNNNVAGPATIMVGPDVKAVSVSNCQAWLWQGADLNAAASGTAPGG